MGLSKRSLETLTDLVEIKISCMQVFDRDDARELAALEQCLRELNGLAGGANTPTVVPFPDRDEPVPAAGQASA